MAPPKVFVSYSWSSPSHEAWVIALAEELIGSGIDVIFDKGDLREGFDAHAFMERMVTDPEIKKVILICDRVYKEKADKRKGGAGTEAQIITPELYGRTENNKFCAVLSERDPDGQPYLPAYYQARIYIDLSDETQRALHYEKLLRWIVDKPTYIKPAIGKLPDYIMEDSTRIKLATSHLSNRAIDALRNGKSYLLPAVEEYYDTLASELTKFRYDSSSDRELFFSRGIGEFVPYRNEAIETTKVLVKYGSEATYHILHKFFENSIPYLGRPAGQMQWNEQDFDIFRFVLYELLISVVAVHLEAQKFEPLTNLLLRDYYVPFSSAAGGDSVVPFTFFQSNIYTLEIMNNKASTKFYFPRAKLLLDRLSGSGLERHELLEADLVMALASQASLDKAWWYPDTLPMEDRSGPHPTFARSVSKSYFDKVRFAIGLTAQELIEVAEELDKRGGFFQHAGYFRFSMRRLIGSDKLATRP